MSANPQSLQFLSEQNQRSHLPQSPPPRIQSADVGEDVRGSGGDDEEQPEESTSPLNPSFLAPLPKKVHGRRKKHPFTPKQRAKAELRLQTLTENFRPVPFFPGKTLDFSAHETLFRSLGLWDFAHLELHNELRTEFLVELIANYDHAGRRSYVQGTRISVNRTDLARALGLPTRKEKANAYECTDVDVCVLLEFISNYIPMPYGDDMCILPPEIMQAIQFVRERLPQKVDWAALMWVLVEKELLDAPKSGVCHCATHLQCLIKYQQPHLFEMKEEPVLESVVEAQEQEEATVVKEEDDYRDTISTKMKSLNDLGNVVLEENNEGFPLTLADEENSMGDYEEGKVRADEAILEQVKNVRFENFNKSDEQEGQEMKSGYDLSAKFSSLNLLQAMGNTNYGDFLAMGAESSGKRQASSMYEEDGQFEPNYHKRMRNGESWSNLSLSSAELVEQLQSNTVRVKLLYAEKDKAIVKMQMQAQCLNQILEEKEESLSSLKLMIGEQQHWRLVVHHYEHELSLMTKMLLGYKKALKETRISFADYKRNHSQEDEALVPETGESVLSMKEFEQHPLKKEEARQKLLETFGILEKVLVKFEECEERIMLHNRKLVKLCEEVKQLKERLGKSNSASI